MPPAPPAPEAPPTPAVLPPVPPAVVPEAPPVLPDVAAVLLEVLVPEVPEPDDVLLVPPALALVTAVFEAAVPSLVAVVSAGSFVVLSPQAPTAMVRSSVLARRAGFMGTTPMGRYCT